MALSADPMQATFTSPIWRYPGAGSWHFITLPEDLARDLNAHAPKGGWGSVKVRVTIGTSTWKTSVFPDKRYNSYILPVKKQVRSDEKLIADNLVTVNISVV